MEEHYSYIGFCIILLLLLRYHNLKVNGVEKYGVISIAKVLEFQSSRSGTSYVVDIYFKNKRIRSKIPGADCNYKCVGNFYFIKFLENDPTKYAELYKDKPVPSCIHKRLRYYKGLDHFPSCDDVQITTK